MIELLTMMKAALPLPSLPALPSHKGVSAPSMTPQANKKLPGVNPPSNKDPKKIAEQLKSGQPPKAKIKTEVFKTDTNGQWSIDEV